MLRQWAAVVYYLSLTGFPIHLVVVKEFVKDDLITLVQPLYANLWRVHRLVLEVLYEELNPFGLFLEC